MASFLDFLAILQTPGFSSSHWCLHMRGRSKILGSLSNDLFPQAPGIYLLLSLHSTPLSAVLLSPTIFTAFFISFARISNFLQWGKTPAHLHVPSCHSPSFVCLGSHSSPSLYVPAKCIQLELIGHVLPVAIDKGISWEFSPSLWPGP